MGTPHTCRSIVPTMNMCFKIKFSQSQFCSASIQKRQDDKDVVERIKLSLLVYISTKRLMINLDKSVKNHSQLAVLHLNRMNYIVSKKSSIHHIQPYLGIITSLDYNIHRCIRILHIKRLPGRTRTTTIWTSHRNTNR